MKKKKDKCLPTKESKMDHLFHKNTEAMDLPCVKMMNKEWKSGAYQVLVCYRWRHGRLTTSLRRLRSFANNGRLIKTTLWNSILGDQVATIWGQPLFLFKQELHNNRSTEMLFHHWEIFQFTDPSVSNCKALSIIQPLRSHSGRQNDPVSREPALNNSTVLFRCSYIRKLLFNPQSPSKCTFSRTLGNEIYYLRVFLLSLVLISEGFFGYEIQSCY